ncbi:MAG: FecR family protein [Spirochaetales bacterium]|nr:FecR family protein [Spirochaetales bacterium]
MMKKSAFVFLLTLFLLPLSAQSFMEGEIIYLEGDVNVSRNGEWLPYYEVDMGLSVEENDIIKTGPDGYLEIELTYPGQGGLLKVQADTVFYFEGRETGGVRTAKVNLLNGSLGLKVAKLASNEKMNVETQTAVMGIRGTEFIVDRSPTGEVLVSCNEGRVSCAASRTETYSIPGMVCLQNENQSFKEEAVPVEELEEYRSDWWDLRIEALVKLGPLSVDYYLGRYENQLPQFNQAWSELARQEELFTKYEALIRSGETPDRSKATRDKISLTSPIIKMRSALPLMEEIYYTLYTLEQYQSRGFFEGNEQAMRDFDRNEKLLENQIIKAHYYLDLYGQISSYAAGGTNSTLNSMLNN